MAIKLTGQNIKDTYQQLIHSPKNGLVYDGTGSLLPLKFDGNDIIVSGAVKAESYIVSESILSVSSGSTVFGNSADDTHTITGNITASGNISSSGTIIANETNIIGNITASGNISASGTGSFGYIILEAGGAITPSINGEQITFRASEHGAHDFMRIGEDLWTVYINGRETLALSSSANADNDGQFTVNAANDDIIFKVMYEDGAAALQTDALNNRIKLGGFATIGLSGSALPHADAVGGTNTALLISGSQFNIGAITASGDISCSGNLIGIIDGGTF